MFRYDVSKTILLSVFWLYVTFLSSEVARQNNFFYLSFDNIVAFFYNDFVSIRGWFMLATGEHVSLLFLAEAILPPCLCSP